jgi:hypothetical protein
MPDVNGKALPGEAGYVAPNDPNPNISQPGLINATPGQNTVSPAAPVTSYTPAQADTTQSSGTGYTPTAFTMSPDQTVSGQIKNIIAEDSPLMPLNPVST